MSTLSHFLLFCLGMALAALVVPSLTLRAWWLPCSYRWVRDSQADMKARPRMRPAI